MHGKSRTRAAIAMHDEIDINPAGPGVDCADRINALFDGVFTTGPDGHAIVRQGRPLRIFLPTWRDQQPHMDGFTVISLKITAMKAQAPHMWRKVGDLAHGQLAEIGQLSIAFACPLPTAIKIGVWHGLLQDGNNRRLHLHHIHFALGSNFNLKRSFCTAQLDLADRN